MTPGSKLKNGATLLERRGDCVLAMYTGHHHPFVTWRIDQDGNTFLGHYFQSLEQAAANFAVRGRT